MKVYGIEGMSLADLEREVQQGGRFVIFPYCISALVVTFRRSSDIYFLHSGESHWTSANQALCISLLLGWWGLPWGPIFTIVALLEISSGRRNVTAEVLSALYGSTTQ